jgi:hypothetical protein
MKLLGFLDKNNDIFAWSTSDLVGVNRDVIENQLQVSPSAKLKQQKIYKNGEGWGTEITRCRFHQRSEIPRVAGKCRHGEKMENDKCVQIL